MLVLGGSSAAAAQEASLDAARDSMRRAAFAEAVERYDAILEGDTLATSSRAELRVVLEERAIARHAARDTAGAERDLVGLLSLEQRFELDQTAPPALHRAVERLRGEVSAPLSIDASAEPRDGGATLRARAIGDLGGLVREVRIAWRSSGEDFVVTSGEELEVDAAIESVTWYAELVGPGGAVLARHEAEARAGSSEPLPSVTLAPSAGEPAPSGGDDGVAIGLGVGIGLAVVLGVTAGLLVFFLTPEPNTALSAPMERTP